MRPPPTLLTGAAAVVTVIVAVASGQLGPGYPDRAGSVTLLSDRPAAGSSGQPVHLDVMAQLAIRNAARNGADISIALLDRATGQKVIRGDRGAFPIASVAKLFIADDLLMRVHQGGARLSREDRRALDTMLRSSDDFAANEFWQRGGRNAVIERIRSRYGLPGTVAPSDANWWTTMSTTADLVDYYGKLLSGSGGLPADGVSTMLADLAASAPTGIDGYPQRFGIPDGLPAEPVAVKQGWMCCWDGPNQVHLSTGVAGADRRYVIAVAAMQPTDERVARETLTDAVSTMFPGGRI
jgi:ethanolamine utilization microcompartment shell protein EutS